MSLRFVDSRRAGGCQKPGCNFSGTLHRHHIRHEATWLGIWSGRRKSERRWVEFVARYWEFRHEDYIVICPDHHAEIHKIYDQLIIAHKRSLKISLARYTWDQADDLMNRFEEACRNWLAVKSPGMDNATFARQRKTRSRKQ